MRKPFAFAFLCLAAGMWLLPACSTLAASAPPRITILPSTSAGVEKRGSGYFQIEARPGTTITRYVLVGNVGASTAVVHLVPVDASSGVYGGISYHLPGQPVDRVGSWVTPTVSWVRLAAGQYRVVRVSIRVPAHLRAGQYIGGLTAFVPAHPAHADGGSTIGGLTIQVRSVLAVEVSIPGLAHSRLLINRVYPRYQPTGLYVMTAIRNTGNRLLAATGRLTVRADGASKPLMNQPLTVSNTVPGTAVRYPTGWPGLAVNGLYHAHAVLRWAAGKTQWSGAFRIGSPPKGSPKPPPGGPGGPPSGSVMPSTSGNGLPASALEGFGLGAGLVLLILASFLFRRHTLTRGASQPTAP